MVQYLHHLPSLDSLGEQYLLASFFCLKGNYSNRVVSFSLDDNDSFWYNLSYNCWDSLKCSAALFSTPTGLCCWVLSSSPLLVRLLQLHAPRYNKSKTGHVCPLDTEKNPYNLHKTVYKQMCWWPHKTRETECCTLQSDKNKKHQWSHFASLHGWSGLMVS